MTEYRPLRIALVGAGSVGAQVARLLTENKNELAARVGAELDLVGIAVRDLNSKRAEGVPAELVTTDAESLILGADIVIEVTPKKNCPGKPIRNSMRYMWGG